MDKNPKEFTSLYDEGSDSDKVYFVLQRKLFRPKIRIKIVVLKIIITLIISALLGVLAKIIIKKVNVNFSSSLAGWLTSCLFLLFLFILKLKKIIIWLVLFYQKVASDKVRNRCVFTPSCSEYMILSVKKYGVIKGVIKGIKRLKRCHLPNFGEDYP